MSCRGALLCGVLLLSGACAPVVPRARGPDVPRKSAPGESGAAKRATSTPRRTQPSRSQASTSPAAPPATPSGENASDAAAFTCPEEMALVRRVQGPYCIDRWEGSIVVIATDGSESLWPGNRKVDGMERRIRAASVVGRKPQGYISGEQAARACARSGKRLCEIDEWVRACRGPQMMLYPYGNQRRPKLCNDRYKILDHHPVVRLFKQEAPAGTDPVKMWHPRWMNDPRLHDFSHTVTPTGAFETCTNGYGVYDMVGNLHEWVADPDGTFFGGFFMDTFQNGEGCEYRTVAHPFDYHDYSTGLRCCADPTLNAARA